MEPLTIAMEHYLETVYELAAGAESCRVSDIALRLGVSKASVNNAMNVLAARGGWIRRGRGFLERKPGKEL